MEVQHKVGQDTVTEVILNNLKKSKLKLDHVETTLNYWKWMALVLTGIFVGYIMVFLVIPNWRQPEDIVFQLLNNIIYLVSIFCLIFVYAGHNFYLKKQKKIEEEFHMLRCEVIRRGEELWPDEHWDIRHETFKQLDEEFGINLYHEN